MKLNALGSGNVCLHAVGYGIGNRVMEAATGKLVFHAVPIQTLASADMLMPTES